LSIFFKKISGIGRMNKLMQKALIWLYQYGRQAVRHKLKKGVKMHYSPKFSKKILRIGGAGK
jgi:hypothetical protein